MPAPCSTLQHLSITTCWQQTPFPIAWASLAATIVQASPALRLCWPVQLGTDSSPTAAKTVGRAAGSQPITGAAWGVPYTSRYLSCWFTSASSSHSVWLCCTHPAAPVHTEAAQATAQQDQLAFEPEPAPAGCTDMGRCSRESGSGSQRCLGCSTVRASSSASAGWCMASPAALGHLLAPSKRAAKAPSQEAVHICAPLEDVRWALSQIAAGQWQPH